MADIRPTSLADRSRLLLIKPVEHEPQPLFHLTHRSRLRVKLFTENDLRPGRGFWNPIEQVVEYHTIPHFPYRSYLENDSLRIDLDFTGQPVFVEVRLPESSVTSVDPTLEPLPDFEIRD